jgi:ribosomal protein S18 acetylase RimI-like enzyme
MSTLLRPAIPVDAAALAGLHARVWRHTYCDLAPAMAIASLDEAMRLRRWTEILADPLKNWGALVAEIDGRLAGFGLCGPPGETALGERGEVKFLYVDTGQARRGLGRRLLAAMAGMLRERGYRGLALGVVVGNDPAIAFYEAMGGARVGRYTDPGPVWRSDNFVYAWDDLASLISFASAPSSRRPA